MFSHAVYQYKLTQKVSGPNSPILRENLNKSGQNFLMFTAAPKMVIVDSGVFPILQNVVVKPPWFCVFRLLTPKRLFTP